MTSYEFMSLLISLIGFVAVIISLMFVAKQNKMIADSLHENTIEHTMGPVFELSKVFIEYPDIRKYFYSEETIDKNHPCYDRVIAISYLVLDTFDHYFVNEHLLISSYKTNKERWNCWIVDMFRNSPALRSVYSEYSEWYPDDFKKLYQIAQDSTKNKIANQALNTDG